MRGKRSGRRREWGGNNIPLDCKAEKTILIVALIQVVFCGGRRGGRCCVCVTGGVRRRKGERGEGGAEAGIEGAKRANPPGKSLLQIGFFF